MWREFLREIITWSWLVETQRCESCYQEQKYKNKRSISLSHVMRQSLNPPFLRAKWLNRAKFKSMILSPKNGSFQRYCRGHNVNKRFVYTCEIWHTNWTSNNVLVSYDYKWIYTRVSIQKKFERYESYVYIHSFSPPPVMSRTDAQNALYCIAWDTRQRFFDVY